MRQRWSSSFDQHTPEERARHQHQDREQGTRAMGPPRSASQEIHVEDAGAPPSRRHHHHPEQEHQRMSQEMASR